MKVRKDRDSYPRALMIIGFSLCNVETSTIVIIMNERHPFVTDLYKSICLA